MCKNGSRRKTKNFIGLPRSFGMYHLLPSSASSFQFSSFASGRRSQGVRHDQEPEHPVFKRVTTRGDTYRSQIRTPPHHYLPAFCAFFVESLVGSPCFTAHVLSGIVKSHVFSVRWDERIPFHEGLTSNCMISRTRSAHRSRMPGT